MTALRRRCSRLLDHACDLAEWFFLGCAALWALGWVLLAVLAR